MTVLPFGKSAVISASMLGLGRALGETMAVAIILSVSGGVTFNLISSANPSTIAANIALDFPESSGIDDQHPDRLRPRAVRRDADHQHGRPGDHQPRGEDLMSIGDERKDPPVTQPEEKPPPTPPKVGDTAPPAADGSGDAAVVAPAVLKERPPSQRPSVATGTLPPNAPWLVLGGVAVGVALILLLIGFNAALFVVATAVITGVGMYGWSRAVEGRRKATDRGMTVLISCAFAIARHPARRRCCGPSSRSGVARFDPEFFTETQRGVIGAGRRRGARDHRHARSSRARRRSSRSRSGSWPRSTCRSTAAGAGWRGR